MFDVIIATPGHSMCAEYVQSLMKTVQVLNARKITWIDDDETGAADACSVALAATATARE